MIKQNGDNMEEEWMQQQAMAMRAMEQVGYFFYEFTQTTLDVVHFSEQIVLQFSQYHQLIRHHITPNLLQAANDEAYMRAQIKADHLAFLRGQMQEQKEKKQEWDQTKQGAIDEQFFQSFGRGHR